MIQLECSNCNTMLSIDDAFAGGVCRCQYCGTIQTVPRPSSSTAQMADAASPKALFRRKARIESALSPYNDDLDRAADQMESSGALSPNALSGISAAPRRSSSSPSPGDSAAGTSPVGRSQAETPAPRRAAATAGATVSRPSATATAPQPARPAASQVHFVPKPSSSTVVPQPASQAGVSNKTPLIIAAAAAGVLVCGAGLWLALSGGSSSAPVPTAQVAPAPEPKPAPAVAVTRNPEPKPVPVVANRDPEPKPAVPPVVVNHDPEPKPTVVVTRELDPDPVVVIDPAPSSLAGISLGGESVVYILDRAGCTAGGFQQILDACYGSIQSLGQQRKFALIVWNGRQDLAFPKQDLAAASAANLDACRKLMVATSAGATDIGQILGKAVAARPADIVLVSATDMDDLTAMAIRGQLAKASAPVRFHGVALGMELTAARLKPLVADHGGQFQQVEATGVK